MPFTTETDMRVLAEMLKSKAIDVTPEPVAENEGHALSGMTKQLPEASVGVFADQVDHLDPKLLTVEILREQMEASPLNNAQWQKQLANASGVSESLVQKIMQGKKTLSTRTAKKLLPYIFHEEV
jgi:hypothetical protein